MLTQSSFYLIIPFVSILSHSREWLNSWSKGGYFDLVRLCDAQKAWNPQRAARALAPDFAACAQLRAQFFNEFRSLEKVILLLFEGIIFLIKPMYYFYFELSSICKTYSKCKCVVKRNTINSKLFISTQINTYSKDHVNLSTSRQGSFQLHVNHLFINYVTLLYCGSQSSKIKLFFIDIYMIVGVRDWNT